MAFNLEDLAQWENLSPSLQARFKDMENQIKTLSEMIDRANGATFKSWNLKMWETSHIFTDLSFYETMRVVQSGTNNKISGKRYNNVHGDLDTFPHLREKAMWIKHQLVWQAPGDVPRLYLGGRGGNGGIVIYRSDPTGLDFEVVATLGTAAAIWDMVEYKGAMYLITYSDTIIYKTTDGLHYTEVKRLGGNPKTLCVFKNILYCVSIGVTYYTTDGVNWTSVGNNISDGHVYSRYTSDDAMYIGTCGAAIVWKSTNGTSFTAIRRTNSSYVRWIIPWTPKNNKDHPGQNVEYIVWGCGGSGTENGTARLEMYDPVDGQVYILFDFRTGNGSLNDGHSPIEPIIPNSSKPSGYAPAGFRERQIRYIQVFDNDYTGESFLMVGTSDSHFWNDLHSTTLYYGECNRSTGQVTPILDEKNQPRTWTDSDKEAWRRDTETNGVNGDQYPANYMGNVYAVGPRDPNAFKKDDLVITMIKHTDDTRVYSMSVFTDPDGVKWAYAGTGGGNYSGKGLLYRFGYSDMLDLIEAAKIGAIFPPRWEVEGAVNKRIKQQGTRFYLKITSGASAREGYTEMRFAFSKNFIKSTATEPYIQLISNMYNSANCYIMRMYPLQRQIQCILRINNIDTVLKTITIPALKLYEVDETREAVDAPQMGPYYALGIEVLKGAINPKATTSYDKYLYGSLDGTVNFLYKVSNMRDDVMSDDSIVCKHVIDYAGGERKNIGIYGLETFDCPGLYLISTKQCSIDKHNLDKTNTSLEGSGEIVFGVY